MRIRGVLLGTVEEQRAGGDEHPIDPEKVELFEDGHVPVTVNFDRARVLGKVLRVWRADGRLMFEADLDEGAPHRLQIPPKHGKTAAFGGTRSAVYSIALTDENQNRDQPPWQEVPELQYGQVKMELGESPNGRKVLFGCACGEQAEIDGIESAVLYAPPCEVCGTRYARIKP